MYKVLSRNPALLKGIPNHVCRTAQISHRNFSQQDKMEREVTRDVVRGPTEMTGSEAFVETLVSQGVTDIFGIVGSAFMDALDLFPSAGIRFISTQHEQNAVHMADGFARISGKPGVCTAQNGPGITNFVTGMAAAYWAHSPVVAITPEAGTATKGLGGFQEADQLPIFAPVTKYQANINNSTRIPELTSRAFDIARYERGPTQINIPRDLFYSKHQYTIPEPTNLAYPCGNDASLQEAVSHICNAKNPVILAGGGVVMSGENAIKYVTQLAELLNIPVATTYLHNDSFPTNHPLAVGPLGYQGFQSAMKCMKDADLVLAIGTRLSPFGTLPQYNFDYWPSEAKIIQVDIDHRRLGLVKPAHVYIQGDAGLVCNKLVSMLRGCGDSIQSNASKQDRLNRVVQYKKEWEDTLNEWTYKATEKYAKDGRISPRKALRELEKAMPKDAMVSTDIGNVCSVANSYLRFEQSPSFLAAMTFGNCQYAFGAAMGAKVAAPHRPAISYAGDGAWGMSLNEFLTCTRENIPVTAVVFHNEQWGAEKKNQVLWFGDRYVGVNLSNPWSYAEIAKSMNGEGIRCTHEDQIGDALKQAIENQMNGKATVLELMLTKELGDPFRRDAMKLPKRCLSKYQHTDEVNESPTGQPVDM